MSNKFQIKRTTIAGRTPNTTSSGNTAYIGPGELAINLTDGTFFSSSGSTLLYLGSNVATFNATSSVNLPNTVTVSGTSGTNGQYLGIVGSNLAFSNLAPTIAIYDAANTVLANAYFVTGASINQLSDVDTVTTAPSNNNVLTWSNAASNWVPMSSLSIGSLTSSDNVTLSGGTTNGVAYLNGSKVVTTGSALTFDGTNLGVGTATPWNSGNYATITLNGFTGGQIAFKSGDVAKQYIYNTATDITYRNDNGAQIWFSGSELMRLTSTGLGIGTSSPDAKLTVYGNAPAFTMQTSRSFTVNRNWQIGVDQITEGNWTLTPSTTLGGTTYTTPAITVSPAGNLGLGVTPSASWGTSGSKYNAFQFGATGFLYGRTGNEIVALGSNIYADGTNNRYLASGNYATMYTQASGTHQWYTAGTGTAGGVISLTQVAQIQADGSLWNTSGYYKANQGGRVQAITLNSLPSGQSGYAYTQYIINDNIGSGGDPAYYYIALCPAYQGGATQSKAYFTGFIYYTRGQTYAGNIFGAAYISVSSAYNSNVAGGKNLGQISLDIVTFLYAGTYWLGVRASGLISCVDVSISGIYASSAVPAIIADGSVSSVSVITTLAS